MRLYLAAPFVLRKEIEQVAYRIMQETNHEITSSWLFNDGFDDPDTHTDDVDFQASIYDLHDISSSEMFVLFDGRCGCSPSTGRYVEYGYALNIGMTLWVVGSPTNIFTKQANRFCLDVDDLIEQLKKEK